MTVPPAVCPDLSQPVKLIQSGRTTFGSERFSSSPGLNAGTPDIVIQGAHACLRLARAWRECGSPLGVVFEHGRYGRWSDPEFTGFLHTRLGTTVRPRNPDSTATEGWRKPCSVLRRVARRTSPSLRESPRRTSCSTDHRTVLAVPVVVRQRYVPSTATRFAQHNPFGATGGNLKPAVGEVPTRDGCA